MRKIFIPLVLTVGFFGCEFDKEPQLPSVEERVEEASTDLIDLLTAPANGWRLDYQPNVGGAEYLIIMEYGTDGSVRIQSDVITESGEFRDDTISYRIDARQGLELIMETYGVFHFLAEVVGGGFQFIFVNEVDGNLVFSTKEGPLPVLTFQPAGPNDADEISVNAIPDLAEGIFQSSNITGVFVPYNIYVPTTNHTISISFDLQNRRAHVIGVATGQTMEEIIAGGSGTQVDERSNFIVRNDILLMDNPITTSHNGSNYTISEIPVENLRELTESFCISTTDSVVRFNSTNVTGIGNMEMTSSLFLTHTTFVEDGENPYGASPNAVFDENDNSLLQDVEAAFPGVVVQQWYQGFDLGNGEQLTAFGWVSLNDLNQVNFYLREFSYTMENNLMSLTLGDLFIVKRDGNEVTDEERQNLTSLTDRIFEGGELLTMEVLSLDGGFQLFNACNGYKVFVFGS